MSECDYTTLSITEMRDRDVYGDIKFATLLGMGMLTVSLGGYVVRCIQYGHYCDYDCHPMLMLLQFGALALLIITMQSANFGIECCDRVDEQIREREEVASRLREDAEPPIEDDEPPTYHLRLRRRGGSTGVRLD